MDQQQSEHLARVRHLRETFAAANERLVGRLRGASDEAAQAGAEGKWSAAQLGWHVAAVTSRFAGLISGDVPGAGPLPPDFVERPWADIVSAIPAQLNAPLPTVPPPGTTRHNAISALEAAGMRMARAFDSITADRGPRAGINHALVGGTINLYQLGEWATAHILRHDAQAQKALGGV